MARAVVRVAAALVLLVIGMVAPASPASAGPIEDEQRFIQLINQTRATEGLGPLIVNGELGSAARSWTASMAAADRLSHTADMATGISADWSVLGENVGVHTVGAVDQLFQAFVASPAHYRNLVDPRFTHIGVGVTHTESGKLWTTHRFMKVNGAPEPPPPTTAPDPTTTVAPTTRPPSTRPSTTVTPTTRPPKTTTPIGPTTTSGPADLDPRSAATVPVPATSTTTSPRTDEGVPDTDDLIDLVQPDAETIEDVLIDLVAAGI